MGYTELLNSLSLQPSSTLAEIGVPITFTILPDLGSVQVTEVRMVDVDFEFMAKGFVFTNDDLDDLTTTGTLPIQDLVSNPPAVLPGVPGLLGRLRGQMPVAVPVDVAPRLEVVWQVRDERGRDLIERGDAVATAGVGGTSQSILFLPEVIELTSADDPGTTPRRVTAQVTMFAGSTNVGTRTLGPVEVQVRRLAMPTILAMFLHKNYTGYILVVIPEETYIFSLGNVTGNVQALYNLLIPFATNPRLGFVVEALATLHAALLSEDHIQFRKTNEIGNLNDITLAGGTFNDTEAEDELSSLLLVAPPERAVDFFNDRNFEPFEGTFTLKTHEQLVAGVRDLHADFPSVEPVGASLLPRLQPAGSDTFGDELSSLRFSPLIGE
jgi:hypothetical protein